MKRISVLLGGLTLFLALNGFQCASSMMNSAQMAIDKGDYAKAKTSAEEELALRPENAKAWLLLGRSEKHLGNYVAMKRAFDKAVEHRASETGALTDAEVEAIRVETFSAWSDLYDRSQVERERGRYETAAAMLDTALILLPGSPMTYALSGVVRGQAGDEAGSKKAFSQYVEVTREDIARGLEDGLRLNFSPERVAAIFGKPTFPYSPPNNQFGDYFKDRNLMVFYRFDPSNKTLSVRGWDYLEPGQRPLILSSLSADPYHSRAFDLRATKEYDEAIELLTLVDGLDPDRQDDVGNLLAQIYIDAGRVDEAEAELNRRIAANPEIVAYRIRYSVLKHKQGDYAGAVSALEDALNLKMEQGGKEHRDILYNLGAFHKNWGISLQEAAGNSPSRAQEEEIMEKYRTSLEYYQKLDALDKSFDYVLLHEIGMMLVVTGQQSDLPAIISRFESEKENPEYSGDSRFWRNLSKLYLQMSSEGEAYLQKATEASTRAKELGG